MSQPPRARVARLAGAVALGATLLLPSAAPVAAADPVVLRVATTQDLLVSNPWNSTLVVDYEAYQLTYDLLLNFDKDAKPGPGFADTWERSTDKVTFHIREGMKWSDGEPATSADVCFSWGLAMAAIKADSYIGNGYLDPDIKNSGVTKIECPDANTFVAYTTDPSDRVLQTYVPIIPKHVWDKYTYETIAEQKFDPPLVGTGPYTMVEWKIGQFARFIRNPNYWGQKGFADEVVLQFFPDATDTMVQALKSGDIDYAHNVNPDQFKQLQTDSAYTAVEGASNGWTQIAFNTYGTGTGKTIPGGGPSTKALLDPKFRDALGYAVDKNALVERVLGGFGDVGTTNVPPILSDWHVEPTTVRTFDIDLAKQKLDRRRLSPQRRRQAPRQGEQADRPPRHLPEHPRHLREVRAVRAGVVRRAGHRRLAPEPRQRHRDQPRAAAGGRPARQGRLRHRDLGLVREPGPELPAVDLHSASEIGVSSDSQYCNPDYDALYEKQLTQAGDERKATLAEMQNIIYNDAPYDILFYDSNLDVYRNDKFAGWQNMPSEHGVPFFTYGTLDYTLLTDASAQPSPTAAPESPTPRRFLGAVGRTDRDPVGHARPGQRVRRGDRTRASSSARSRWSS